jgi:hypothetical protein
MTPTDAITLLRTYNKWRRGDESIEQPHPTEIGVAIDTLCITVQSIDKSTPDEPEQVKCGTTHYAGCACHEQGWKNKWMAAVEMAAYASLERDGAIKERNQLARWKQEHLTVESWWNEIDKAVRNHPDTILGDTIAHTALRFIRERDEARSELEREQIRLAACSVIALADTPESAVEARKMHPDYHSASADDVARRVDECMKLRNQLGLAKILLMHAAYGVITGCGNSYVNAWAEQWLDHAASLGAYPKDGPFIGGRKEVIEAFGEWLDENGGLPDFPNSPHWLKRMGISTSTPI